MSGIYIPGISKPENCSKCNKIFRFCQTEEDGSVWCCMAKGYLGEESTKCPLIPVPPRGRLIDADELMERFSYSPGDTAEDRIWIRAARRIIIEASTIIPADRGEG